ncbi:hypothetical protein ACFQ07_19025, partial [Actinomadura adrarensis]
EEERGARGGDPAEPAPDDEHVSGVVMHVLPNHGDGTASNQNGKQPERQAIRTASNQDGKLSP